MKKLLLVAGIVLIVACVMFLLFAAVYYSGYRNLIDGTAEHYARLHRKAIIFAITGIALALAGAVCMIFRYKM